MVEEYIKYTDKCCICGKEIDIYHQNNAFPLKEGKCCDKCNFEKVVPYRIQLILQKSTGLKEE